MNRRLIEMVDARQIDGMTNLHDVFMSRSSDLSMCPWLWLLSINVGLSMDDSKVQPGGHYSSYAVNIEGDAYVCNDLLDRYNSELKRIGLN